MIWYADRSLQAMSEAWAGIKAISFSVAATESNPQLVQIVPPNEVVVATTFTIELGPVSGEMHFCTPYSMIEPIRDLLTSSLQGETLETDKRWVRLMTQQIQTAEVELIADLGTAKATLEDLLNLKVGDIIPINVPEMVEAKVDGVPVMECLYGQLNGQYALRVEKLLHYSTNEFTLGDDHG
jgi:flagellar motor switch protein FliM